MTPISVWHRLNKERLIPIGLFSHDDFEYNWQFGFDYTTQMAQLDYIENILPPVFQYLFYREPIQNIQSNLKERMLPTGKQPQLCQIREH